MPAKDTSHARKREQIGNEIAALMGPLVRDLRAAFQTCAAELGLALSEAQAIWLLEMRGALATKDFARALDVDPANASTLITKLERRGLVSREAADDDRRRRLVSLTAEGQTIRRQLAQCIGERRPSFRELTTEELATFRDLLRRVQRPG
jgi:MarR family transcriptional regulator, organic hydroperoxide resistance regulator